MSVEIQSIEGNLRDWKKLWDEYSTLEHQASKLLEEADLYAGKIVALMKKSGHEKVKTYYGTVALDDKILSVSGHAARYHLPAPAKKKAKKKNSNEIPVL